MTFLNRRLFGNYPSLFVFSLPKNVLQHLFKEKKMNCLLKQLQITLNKAYSNCFRKKNTEPLMLKKQKGNHPELMYNEGNGNYWIQRFPESHSSNVFLELLQAKNSTNRKEYKMKPC